VEGLAKAFGASPAKVDPSGFAAFFSDWSYSKESHCFGGALKPLSIGAEGCQ
jgi:hypothetical protein